MHFQCYMFATQTTPLNGFRIHYLFFARNPDKNPLKALEMQIYLTICRLKED